MSIPSSPSHEFVSLPDDPPLVPEQCGPIIEDAIFDEDGGAGELPKTLQGIAGPIQPVPQIVFDPARFAIDPTARLQPTSRPCSLAALNGSWNLVFKANANKGFSIFGNLRGPLRLEATGDVLRVSGDMYYKSLIPSFIGGNRFAGLTVDEFERSTGISTTGLLPFRKNWYPHYPFKEYRWYFRSTSVTYRRGVLFIRFVRHLWNGRTQEFEGSDNGWMRLQCETKLLSSFRLPQPTLQMKGTAMVGGKTQEITATKTSPFYRGCVVEVDVMNDRSFPTNVAGQTFARIFRTAGMDLSVRISNTTIPEDDLLSTAELHNLLSTWRDIPSIGHTWRSWLLIGSRRRESQGTFGIMFDQQAPHREGAVGFFDPRLGSRSNIAPTAQNQRLGSVPAAFLRTLVHEAGHVFNLFHPKADVHQPATGTTVMNQTGDVIGFASANNPYPNNISWSFNDHNRTSLIHSPDPQVAPGWKEFGWGHSSGSAGVPEPADVLGIGFEEPTDQLQLDVRLPKQVVVGEVITATLKLTNTSDQSLDVPEHLDLSSGSVELHVLTPQGKSLELRDVVYSCGCHHTTVLDPGESVSSTVQVFYTNRGHVFDTPGAYTLSAHLSLDHGSGRHVESAEEIVTVLAPVEPSARRRAELSMHPDVGMSLAIGDFGDNDTCCDMLEELAAIGGETGGAASLVLASSHGSRLRDVRSGKLLRRVDNKAMAKAVKRATDCGDEECIGQLIDAVLRHGDKASVQKLWETSKKPVPNKKAAAVKSNLASRKGSKTSSKGLVGAGK